MPSSAPTLLNRSHAGLAAWFAIALLANAIAAAATHFTPRPEIAAAAAFDVAVTVPAIYYLFVVRPGAQPAITLVPLLALATLRGLYIAPGTAALRPFLGAAAEVAVLGVLVTRIRRGLRAGGRGDDLIERVERVSLEMMRVPAIASIVATETALLYYAFAWRSKAHVREGARPFTVHEESGLAGLFGCFAALTLVEGGVAHLVVEASHPVAAWIMTALNAYGTVWLLAVARSFALRPILVSDETLEIRSGLLASLRVPIASIASAEAIGGESADDWKMVPLSAPNVRVTFRAPVEGKRVYRRKGGVVSVALAVDDPRGFLKAVAR
jgi:hypothetical protein